MSYKATIVPLKNRSALKHIHKLKLHCIDLVSCVFNATGVAIFPMR